VRQSAVIFCLLLTVIFCPKGSAISIHEFLGTAKTDQTLMSHNDEIDFLRSSSSNTPILNAVEVRTRTDRYDIHRQEYAVRLRPNGWGEARIGKKVHEKTLIHNEYRHRMLLNEALKNRYLMIIDLLHNRALHTLERSLMVLYEDKIKVLKKNAGSLDFDAGDLIDAEDQIMELQLDLITLENKISTIEDEIKKIIPAHEPIAFESSKIVYHDRITSILQKIPRVPAKDNIYVKTAETAAELSCERVNLEKAESRRYIDYLEANYDMEEENQLDKALSLEIGFTLPIVNSNRLDFNRRQMESLKEKRRYEDQKKTVAEEILLSLKDLDRLMNQYRLLLEKKKYSKAESSLETYRGVEGADPLILLKLKESSLKTDIGLEKINNRIYAEYIHFLDISGKLIEPPVINYLSPDAEEIFQ
jgi:hypothetical protein